MVHVADRTGIRSTPNRRNARSAYATPCPILSMCGILDECGMPGMSDTTSMMDATTTSRYKESFPEITWNTYSDMPLHVKGPAWVLRLGPRFEKNPRSW